MPIITQEEVNSFIHRLQLKTYATLTPIRKDGEEILNSRQTLETLQFALNNLEYIRAEFSKPDSVGILFKKADTGLSRSFVIVPNASGVLELIVITNQKLSSGEKSAEIGLLGSGNIKDVKYGVCVDTTVAEPRAVMKIELGPVNGDENSKGHAAESLQRLVIEAERSQRYNSPHIVKSYMGPLYRHTIPVNADGLKARTANYSEGSRDRLPRVEFNAVLMFAPYFGHALTTLFTGILTESEKIQIAEEKNAGRVPVICLKLIKEILHGLSAMHAVGDIHADLDCGSILIKRDNETGIPTAGIFDFGFANNTGSITLDTSKISQIVFEMLRDEPDFETLYDEGESDIGDDESKALLIKYPFLRKFIVEDTDVVYTASQLLEELNSLDQAPDAPSKRSKLRSS